MAIIDGGSSTANRANVDANYNLQVRTPTSGIQAGFASMQTEIDAGTVIGTRTVRPLKASVESRLRTGVDTPLFIDRFIGAAQNTTLYYWTVTTGAVAQANGFLSLNSAASVAAAQVTRVNTWRTFPIFGNYGTTVTIFMQLSQLPATFNTTEWGLGIAATTAAPTSFVGFRYNSAGELRCVISSTSTGAYVETTVNVTGFATLIGQNTTRKFSIDIQNEVANFFIDNILVASVPIPSGGDATTLTQSLPLLLRNYTLGGTAAVAQIMRVSAISITLQDMNSSKPWPAVMAGMGMQGSQGQNGQTLGTTATWTNGQTFTAGAISNTAVLAGTSATTGLGGGFNATAQVTSVTDNIISSFPNPLGTAAIPGKMLYIHGVRISAANLGAAVATTPTTIALVANYGHTAVSLATGEAATTKAPRRVPLGIMTWPVGAAVGSMPTNGDIYVPFTSPLPVNPGEFFAVSGRFLVGTATASQTIFFSIGIDSYWE